MFIFECLDEVRLALAESFETRHVVWVLAE
jgi:hypothetical protein